MALTLKRGIRSKYLIFGLFWVRAYGLKREREKRRREKEEGRRKKEDGKEGEVHVWNFVWKLFVFGTLV